MNNILIMMDNIMPLIIWGFLVGLLVGKLILMLFIYSINNIGKSKKHKWWKDKINSIRPNIKKEDAELLHNNQHKNCDGVIIKKPWSKLERYNIFTNHYYEEYTWKCLKCGWESDRIRERIV